MRTFEEFVKQGVVKKKKRDEDRASSLIGGAEKRKHVLEKYLPLNEETAVQVIEECYDIVRELLEATLSAEGYKTYSHEATVAYFAKLGFPKDEVLFLDALREVRHGTKYYGKSVAIDYAQRVQQFLKSLYPKLCKIALEKSA